MITITTPIPEGSDGDTTLLWLLVLFLKRPFSIALNSTALLLAEDVIGRHVAILWQKQKANRYIP